MRFAKLIACSPSRAATVSNTLRTSSLGVCSAHFTRYACARPSASAIAFSTPRYEGLSDMQRLSRRPRRSSVRRAARLDAAPAERAFEGEAARVASRSRTTHRREALVHLAFDGSEAGVLRLREPGRLAGLCEEG